MSRPNYHGAATQKPNVTRCRAEQQGLHQHVVLTKAVDCEPGVVIREEREESCHYADGLAVRHPDEATCAEDQALVE